MLLNNPAPKFTLFNTKKEQFSLEAHSGKKVLLLFFPFAFTSVCTEELCSVRDDIAFYNGANAVVVGISVDSPFTLAKFKEEQRLDFDLLSDFNKEVSAAYNALYPEFVLGLKGVSKRSVFVIDESGVVIYEEVLEKASEVPNFKLIKEALAK